MKFLHYLQSYERLQSAISIFILSEYPNYGDFFFNAVIYVLLQGAPLITMLFWSSLRISHLTESEGSSVEHSQHGLQQKDEEVKLRIEFAQDLIESCEGSESCSCLSIPR